ncbi:MAG: methylenetetrahydrofolate--tRNA-(uracil(54)-C(5))-methyltransferase (FADH(2)-oxidizing) TrmFO [Tenericutes bacterium HGW-Tenericutes-6]|nr:MAG: methylenetetrahydrofolate--tRNA-(uracil(54)-C(5))-methyltransferase (FADH(2)-oxidizing) TrmFO [Tenericutes bacterium HGW-Tenericutes-6]
MVKIIGAGLAGSEAAYYLANQGIQVTLYEMRPKKMTPAHQTGRFAELVCSNSLRSNDLHNAVGLLKEEMRQFDSLIMKAAHHASVPAGSSLAVDREIFSTYIEERIKNHPNIKVVYDEFKKINPDEMTVIAAGPLASESLSESIKALFHQETLHFFDAIAPIIDAKSINMDIAYLKSRYDKGEAAYINCPMTKEEYETFYEAVINAKRVELKDFEMNVFEGCMPFEEMAERGHDTLLFGPMKPVGLEQEGKKRPYAVVQLRQDDAAKSMYNIVGFQTHLTWDEQKKIIRMIPGLEDANILRYGVMHRNTYLESPKLLNNAFQSKIYPNLFFAGQISGVEGYVESAASGLNVAIQMTSLIKKGAINPLPEVTMMGAMASYVSTENKSFVPMNANLGLLPQLDYKHKKHMRKELYAQRSLDALKSYLEVL